MLDFFTIFSKGGIVLWCFQSTSQIFTPSVNALIRSVILQERSASNNSFDHGSLSLKFKLDNEFDLVFVVAYQKILQLSYVDKFLNDVHLEFRDMYKNQLQEGDIFGQFDFVAAYREVLAGAEEWARLQMKVPKQMRSFEESLKSKKTVSSMIERKGEQNQKKPGKGGKKKISFDDEKVPEIAKMPDSPPSSPRGGNGELDEDTLAQNRMKLAQKLGSPNAKKKVAEKQKSPKPKKAGKAPTQWDLGGTNKDMATLERTKDKPSDDSPRTPNYDTRLVGQMVGSIKDLEVDSSSEEEEEDDDDEEVEMRVSRAKAAKAGGMFSLFK